MGSAPMLNIGPQELLLVLIIGLLVVGPQRLPEISRQIGRGLREFRKIQSDVKGLVNLDEVTNQVKGMVRFDGDGRERFDPPSTDHGGRALGAPVGPARTAAGAVGGAHDRWGWRSAGRAPHPRRLARPEPA